MRARGRRPGIGMSPDSAVGSFSCVLGTMPWDDALGRISDDLRLLLWGRDCAEDDLSGGEDNRTDGNGGPHEEGYRQDNSILAWGEHTSVRIKPGKSVACANFECWSS